MSFQEVGKYPSAIFGLSIIVILVFVSFYAIITIPYGDAVSMWRPHNVSETEMSWEKTPKNAPPAWINFFRVKKMPETIHLTSDDEAVDIAFMTIDDEMRKEEISFAFGYPYGEFPDEISLFFNGTFKEKKPHITLSWLTPDGREIQLDSFALEHKTHYRLDQNEKLPRKLGGLTPTVGIFADPNSEEPIPLMGIYTLLVSGILFEDASEYDCEFVLYGKVHGIAGTDHHRRDLKIALLWGAPVALAFGLLGAVGTSLIAMAIAALGAWHGGWVDSLIQRITEVNIILPTLPFAIMIFILYSRSIWTVLLVIVLLNIFGSSIKNYRAAY
jgi:peptide/nickel transport system permease protein